MDDRSDVMRIRAAALPEANPESARDEHDQMCVYALALDQGGESVGTGRLFIDEDSHFRLGRICVTPNCKETGIEDLIARMLLFRAQDMCAASVYTEAPEMWRPFFEQYGFRADGERREFLGEALIQMRVSGNEINLEGACGGHCAR